MTVTCIMLLRLYGGDLGTRLNGGSLFKFLMLQPYYITVLHDIFDVRIYILQITFGRIFFKVQIWTQIGISNIFYAIMTPFQDLLGSNLWLSAYLSSDDLCSVLKSLFLSAFLNLMYHYFTYLNCPVTQYRLEMIMHISIERDLTWVNELTNVKTHYFLTKKTYVDVNFRELIKKD
ncbi:hypothetical protein ACJX0J_010118 [Zea mays]